MAHLDVPNWLQVARRLWLHKLWNVTRKSSSVWCMDHENNVLCMDAFIYKCLFHIWNLKMIWIQILEMI
jgi:hypothetical protein